MLWVPSVAEQELASSLFLVHEDEPDLAKYFQVSSFIPFSMPPSSLKSHIPPVQNTLCHLGMKQTSSSEIALLKATFSAGDLHPPLAASCSFEGEG